MPQRAYLRLAWLLGALPLAVSSCTESPTDTTESAAAPTTSPTSTTTTPTSTTTTATTVPAIETHHPRGMGWDLVWSDEFNGVDLDETKWEFEENCWGGGNEEQQCYTDRVDNTYLSDGILHIRAIEEQSTGLDGSTDWVDSAALGNVMTGFEDDQVFPWKLGSYIASGSLDFDLVETDDEDHETVIETTFNTDEALVYFHAPMPYDLGDWSDGVVEFDMRVIDFGSSTAGLMMKVDCQHPCSSGDFPIDDPVAGEWTHYAVPISELLASARSSLDLTQVNIPFAILPAWGSQNGVVMQIDNVMWTR